MKEGDAWRGSEKLGGGRGRPRHSHASVAALIKPKHASKNPIKILDPPSKST